MEHPKKLVLFDIDGTLIHHVTTIKKGIERFVYGMKQAWGVDVAFDLKDRDGWPDWQSAWDIVKRYGVTRSEYEQGFPKYVEFMRQFLQEQSKDGNVYEKISDAFTLVSLLRKKPEYVLGIMTGNAESIAIWKLRHAGYDTQIFSIALYGDAAVDRITLAKSVHQKSQEVFGYQFAPKDIIVIGDTVHDIVCGEAVGAYTIAVTTAFHDNRQDLINKKPDVLVDSLMDPKIMDFFQLSAPGAS